MAQFIDEKRGMIIAENTNVYSDVSYMALPLLSMKNKSLETAVETIGWPLNKTTAMPFCSERCRLIDLGRWLDEEIGVPVEPGSKQPRDEESEASS